MTRLSSPGWRRALAVWCAVLCPAVAACSGSAATPGHSARPSHSASPTAQPATGQAAIATVKTTWETFFNGAIPIPQRLKLLQGAAQFASFVHSQEKTSLGALVLAATATVSSVTLQPPSAASVRFTILLNGKPLAKNLTGTAVYSGGSWQVSSGTFCSLLKLAYSAKSHLLPAVCGG